MEKPWLDRSHDVPDLAALRALYAAPVQAALAKECEYLHPHYQRYIEAAPFAVLATRGPHGLDTSPRGDAPGFIEAPLLPHDYRRDVIRERLLKRELILQSP